MRLLVILMLLLPVPALAANLVCTVPNAQVPRAVELCEELRQNLHVANANWSNNVCATQFLRIGLRSGERKSTKKASQATVRNDIDIALTAFDEDFPRPVAARCGDGATDSEFGETCDDGNTVSGDGCSEDCQTE